MTRLVALVPMRHASERVPGKNYRPLAGRPLFHHIVRTLLSTPEISQVVIDTDSDVIKHDTALTFPDVLVVDRPQHLRAGTVPMNEVLLYDVGLVGGDYYLQTHATNPLLQPDTVSAAIRRFLEDRRYDSLFGVTRLQTRLWSADGQPINHDPLVLARTQDLPPIYEENSCLYLFSRALLEERGSRIGERPLLFEVPRDQAWDIDEEIDFEVVQALLDWRANR